MSVVVLVPVLRRPHRVVPLLESLRAATPEPHRVLFVCSPGDDEEIAAVDASGARRITVETPPGPGDYARKINVGFDSTDEPFAFLGADDLDFHPGWLTAALEKMADESIGVVGTQDLGNSAVLKGTHSTHSLVRRSYVQEHGTIDEPGKVLHEGYPHEYVDNEFVETAKSRGAWSFAPDSVVEHLHPHWNKAPMDDLYRQMPKRMQQGRAIYQRRQRLWRGRSGPTAPISVIVATFGDESWKTMAERAKASANNQRMPAAEVVAVHGEDLAQARNEGARRASSPWLCFLDADDELDPQFMAAMVRAMRQPGDLLNPAVKFVIPGKPRKPARMFKPKDLSKGNYLVIGTVIRAELFWQAGGFDSQYEAWEDWAMFRRAVALGGRIRQVPRAIYQAHWRGDGRNNTIDDKDGLWKRIDEDFKAWSAAR